MRPLPDLLSIDEIVAHRVFVRSIARGLVADSAGADDLAQETWAHLLERRPTRPRRLRAWLRQVVANLARDRRRGEERRIAREQAHAGASPTEAAGPPTDEIVQRMELQQRLVRHVLALEEPFRAIVLLHHFEGRTVAQAAAELAIPFETARTRLRRALQMLRARLDDELGGGAAAFALLLPLANLPVAATATAGLATAAFGTPLLGVPLVMTTTSKLTLAAASLLVIGGLLYWTGAKEPVESGHRPVAAAAPIDPPRAVAAELQAPADAPTALAPERAEVAAPVVSRATDEAGPLSTALGSLSLQTLWKSDGSPAPLVSVRLAPNKTGGRFPRIRRARTDEKGLLLLQDLPPGEFEVAAAGFAAEDGADGPCVHAAGIRAGATCEITLELPDPDPVAGEVVDGAERPVPGARIWVSDACNAFSDGEFVAAADAQGHFELRSIGRGHYIAAHALGYAMSEVVSTSGLQSSRQPIRLVLDQPGATLCGRVLDPSGRAIADALVAVDGGAGGSRLLSNGSITDNPPPFLTHSDGDGRFAIEALPAGEINVVAHAEGFAPAGTQLEIAAGARLERDLCLTAGGTVLGTVKDASGDAVPGAAVEVLSFLGRRLFQLGLTTQKAGDDGTFELTHVAAGALMLSARDSERGDARVTLQIVAGEVQRCELVLSHGLAFRGRVVDEHGQPIADAKVEALPLGPSPSAIPGPQRTDADGRFVIAGCAAIPYSLKVYDASLEFFAALVQSPLEPGGPELTLVVTAAHRPCARIIGRLLDSDGHPVPAAHLEIFQIGGNVILGQSAGPEGDFALGPFPPGRYWLNASAEGFADVQLGERELAADETLDLGELRVARPATLILRVDRSDGGRVTAADLELCSASGVTFELRPGGDLHAAGQELRAASLPPGDYVLAVVGTGLGTRQIPVACAPGATITLDLHLDPGVATRIRIRRGDGAPLTGPLAWKASNEQGEELSGHARDAAGESFALALSFAPGSWTLEATADDGARGEICFQVGRRTRDDAELELDIPEASRADARRAGR